MAPGRAAGKWYLQLYVAGNQRFGSTSPLMSFHCVVNHSGLFILLTKISTDLNMGPSNFMVDGFQIFRQKTCTGSLKTIIYAISCQKT